MLKIRLQRTGRKNDPYFRVVLTDSKNAAKSGKFLEVLGNYDPKKGETVFREDRVKYWMSKGAKLSETINNFLVKKKIIEGKKQNVLSRKNPVNKKKKKAEAKS